jgi:predicted nucleotidyltransferase
VIPREAELVADRLEQLLGDDLVGVYLHGSAVLGCFGSLSDVDVIAVAAQPLVHEKKRALLTVLLDLSGPQRSVELDVVLVSTFREWRHPAPFEFHYSESLRGRFESGELEPWESRTNRDLAAHVVVTREDGVALVGPPPAEVFPRIPNEDFRDALLYDVEWWRAHVGELATIPGGVRNAVLSLARIWATVATGATHSKATGFDWALARLPAELRPVLEHGRNLYVGVEDQERWQELPVAAYIAAVADEIEAVTPPR